MRVEEDQSVYKERPETAFSREEKFRARVLLRRLRFLEAKARESNPLNDGALHGERERAALAWALERIGFIETQKR